MKSENLTLGHYTDSLQSEGQYWFLRSKAIEALKLSDTAFKFAANRLMKKGKIKRILADFYVIVPLEYQSVGCLPGPWFIDDLMRYCESDYYVCLLSAAAIYGAAHQQPMTFQVMTNRVLRSKRVGKLQLRFHFKKNIKPLFSQQVKTPTGHMFVATPEMTVCEIIRNMNAAGQIHNVATVISELASQIKMSNIKKLINTDDVEVSTIQRLGYLMEYLNLEIDSTPLLKLIEEKMPNYRLLVMGGSAIILEHNKRWRILVNEKVETDL